MNPASVFAPTTLRYANGSFVEGACVTPQERALAEEACFQGVIRGVGQAYQQPRAYSEDTRWRDIDPCEVKNLPTCPCATEEFVGPIAACLAGTTPSNWSDEYHNQWCAQAGAGMMMQDWCPGVSPPPVPECLESRDGVDYCNQYGFGGSNWNANALCWMAMKGGTLPALNALPGCQTTTPGIPPAIPPVSDQDKQPRTQRAGMMLPGLILLAIAVGGGAYYVAQRKKKS